VRATKSSGDVEYLLVDAGFDNLVRPAFYGAYHHISVLGRDAEPTAPRVVAGPLCESADMFTQSKGGLVEPRDLPNAEIGDLLCIHDTGAYAASMASNYNSRLLAPEVLVDGSEPRLVRRRQTFEELVATELECLRTQD
jgi:diaminopimelate decarboxylase